MFFSRYDSATVISLQSQLHLRTVGTCAGRDCAEAGEAAGKLQFGKDLSDKTCKKIDNTSDDVLAGYQQNQGDRTAKTTPNKRRTC